MLENKRLSDRIDSLEFYAKTNNNSSAFHNLIPSTYLNSSSNSSTRGRTPAPPVSRPRLGSGSSTISSSSGINYGSSYGPSYEPSSYRSLSRPQSRQSSVERTTSSADNYSSLINSAFYGSTHRLSDIGSNSIRSRNSSPSRLDSDKWSSYGSTRNISSLPPHPSYDSYSRSKRESSTERSILRNRRDVSQERSTPRPSTSSILSKLRRSSFVDNGPTKYY